MLSLEHIALTALSVVLLVFSAIVHEVAHGYVAHLCGDDTAKEAGRLTLNPARHLDPFGSIVLPIVMGIMGGFVFSYAKPVPYNPYRLKNRRRDEVLVALAGPASNLLQALVGAAAFNGLWALVEANPQLYFSGPLVLGMNAMELLLTVFSSYVWVNLMLAFFNLIPLPPLDGSKVVCYFLKGEVLERYYQVQRYAMPILIFVLYILPRLGFDPLGVYLNACVGNLYNLLLGM
ncbi:site-2 protease family protein [uncultured Parolsenella sp.]|uniref:site-2 protease family protein n=1 Tax=uncultured Parolsenella sp. TaxID=2083008 RepID=UPI0025DC3DA4|nr:site-2 protease family protein [uncultured Parolsenella sp.]